MVNISDPNVVQTEELCIEAVKQNWCALQYVKNQTEAICICAVKQNSHALEYIHNQTEAICICAVKKHGYALQFVHHQTEIICIEAVKKDGWALQFVINQTEAICMEAVREDRYALGFVKNQTHAICIKALNNYSEYKRYYTFGDVYNAIKYPLPQLITGLLKIYPSHTDTIMSTYATDIMKTYKAGSDAICAHLVRHADDLLYRPNNVNALISHARWNVTTNIAKTVFLMV